MRYLIFAYAAENVELINNLVEIKNSIERVEISFENYKVIF